MDKKKLLEMTRGVEIDDIKQIAQQEEQEVTINIIYGEYEGYIPEIWVYTNKATVMRRILRAGIMPTKVEFLQARPDMPWSMDFRYPLGTHLNQFMKVGLYRKG